MSIETIDPNSLNSCSMLPLDRLAASHKAGEADTNIPTSGPV